jgi:acetylcholinesterase
MRNISQASIESYLESYSDAGTTPALSWGPIIDNITAFSNYTSRLLSSGLSKNPTIYGFNDVDEISLDPFPADPLQEGANVTLADEIFTTHFVCTESVSSLFRSQQGIKTYRYQYRGNFSNVSPFPWLGAYHSSELPMIFGTSGDFRGPSTSFELATSRAMQDRWLAFAEDPEGGLERLGWGNSSAQEAAVFGGFDEMGEEVLFQFISLAGLAATCPYK